MAKKNLAQQELEEFDKVFKALAHPTRRHILVVLRSKGDEMPAGEIVNAFSYRWSTITRHMRQLEQSGLISVNKVGTQQLYRLNKTKLKSIVSNWLKWF
jgi:DNA-binding transcriptional ArsR family regulator